MSVVPPEATVWEALRTVPDPEIGENIVDLGLVYRVEPRPDAVEVDITMTTPACPASGSIARAAMAAIRDACPDAPDIKVKVVFMPPWTPDRMSERVKRRFGW